MAQSWDSRRLGVSESFHSNLDERILKNEILGKPREREGERERGRERVCFYYFLLLWHWSLWSLEPLASDSRFDGRVPRTAGGGDPSM